MTLVGNSSELPQMWVVTDQLPFPPRNGITLPLFNYLAGLKNSHCIRLVVLQDGESNLPSSGITANEDLYGPICFVRLARKSKFSRILGELYGKEMYQHGWTYNPNGTELPATPSSILVSPMSAVAKWNSVINGQFTKSVVYVAAVNDCTAAEYYYRYQSHFGNLKGLLKAAIDNLRSRWIGAIEAKLLQSYDAILLQTARDKELMGSLASQRIAAKAVLAPNGVNERFKSVSNKNGKNVVFVGELSGEYGEIVGWLVSDVWPQVVDRCPESKLQIVGKGANETLLEKIKSSRRAENVEYVNDLSDVYQDAMLAISPVFKGFGLINKTVEAMACGVPVVGGIAAFNGIPGFTPNVHGAVCDRKSTGDFVKVISALIEDEEKRRNIGEAGRKLIAGGFSWDRTIKILQNALAVGGPK